MSVESRTSAELTSKQSVEGAASLLLATNIKIWEEINDLETEFLIKKEAELKDLEYS